MNTNLFPFRSPHLFATLLFAATGAAQDSRLQVGRVMPVTISLAATPTGVANDVILVQRPGASFLQLRFVDVDLRDGGRIEVQAPHEAKPEILDAAAILSARGMTLLHGGDLLSVRLCPGQSGVATARIDRVAEGFAGGTHSPLSLCGNDTRQLSAHRQIARLMMTETDGVYWGTGFLIDPLKTMATAGHNVSDTDLLSVIAEFNVPASLADGTPQHPPLQDQYRWEGPAAMQFEHVSGGADWGVLRFQRNAQTNLWPAAAQGGFMPLAQEGPFATQTLRVIGFGDDTARLPRAVTQQTADGPYVGSVGSELHYRVDTEHGNSGSPVFDPITGVVYGVHVRGTCTAAVGTFNIATGKDHAPFAAARVALAGGSAELSVDNLFVPSNLVAGSTVVVPSMVSNAISGSGVSVRCGYFLSTTGALDASARIVAGSPTPYIVSVAGSVAVTHSVIIPTDLQPGPWQFGMWIDSFGQVIEANENNNVRWQTVTIIAPPMTTRAIEYQHTLGGQSHKTPFWYLGAMASPGNGALPVQRGGTAALAVTAPELAGHWSLCACSAINANPFVPDAYTDLCLGNLNSAIFASWLAPLDANGQAFPRFNLPANVAPPLAALYIRAFFVRSDFRALLGESDWFVRLALE